MARSWFLGSGHFSPHPEDVTWVWPFHYTSPWLPPPPKKNTPPLSLNKFLTAAEETKVLVAPPQAVPSRSSWGRPSSRSNVLFSRLSGDKTVFDLLNIRCSVFVKLSCQSGCWNVCVRLGVSGCCSGCSNSFSSASSERGPYSVGTKTQAGKIVSARMENPGI